MNLIVGATGSLGSQICMLLRESGAPVRAMVRATSDPGRVGQLSAAGVEIVKGDLTDTASLRAACAGVDCVISTASMIRSQNPDDSFAGIDDAGQRALIDAATATGVGRFIFISVSGNLTVSCALIDAKRSVEAHLMKSGLDYTILRPTAFIEAWFGPMAGYDHVNHTATVLGTGEQRLSYIAEADVARFAASAVTLPFMTNRIIELGGNEITPRAAVAELEQISGSPYAIQYIPRDALLAQYEAAQHPTQKSFAALMLALSGDDVIPMALTSAEFGFAPRSFAEAVRPLTSRPQAPASAG